VLGLVLGFRPDGGVLGMLLSVALLLVFSFGLSWIWTALGLVLRTPNSVMGVSMMVLLCREHNLQAVSSHMSQTS
jgi:ABC-2 type transport system permease protein